MISDPIEFELFKNALFGVADEMALTVFRTTYSGVLKDNMDYSTAFADGDGRLAAQGLTLPGHLLVQLRRLPLRLAVALRLGVSTLRLTPGHHPLIVRQALGGPRPVLRVRKVVVVAGSGRNLLPPQSIPITRPVPGSVSVMPATTNDAYQIPVPSR